MENWKPIPGYEGSYEVSDQGRVRALSRLDSRGRRRSQRLLSPRRSPNRRLYVALYLGGERADFQIHELVLLAFLGPRPQGAEACHWDDDPTNNTADNLRWATRSENVLDSVRNGTHAMASRTHCPQGHPYTPENTYTYPRGSRACRECRRIYREANADRRREANREYARRKRALSSSRKAA